MTTYSLVRRIDVSKESSASIVRPEVMTSNIIDIEYVFYAVGVVKIAEGVPYSKVKL
jgi:hypothetical protein